MAYVSIPPDQWTKEDTERLVREGERIWEANREWREKIFAEIERRTGVPA